MLKCTLILFLLVFGVLAEDRPIVKIPNGLVKGVYRTSFYGRQYNSFEGVPYAQPPIGDLRFKSPIPKEKWSGMWDANTTHTCIQLDHTPANTLEVHGNEDCLYLNIYTPQSNVETATMDVIVHIHGGAFMFGEGSYYGGDLLMDRDIVFVNINYRVGPLGFLATEDDASPGNYGMKDQSLALKWIKENIEHFGGNPNSITITGLSAGGASVHFHYLSPLSKDLFVRGISLSGTALSNWALVEKPLEKARHVGAAVGCGQISTNDLVNCLRLRPAKQLVAAAKKLQIWLYNPYSPFGVVVEPPSENAFLTEQPYKLIRSGRVLDIPWITSVTTSEGLYPAANYIYSEDRLPFLEKHWAQIAPYILHYDGTVDKNSWVEVAQKIREKYLENKEISVETFPELVQAIGDRLFVAEAEKAARLQAEINKSPVYFYVFDYRGDHSITEYYSAKSDNFGVSHADDVFYITSSSGPWFQKYMQSDDDKKLSKIMIDVWTSFAHKGKPKISGLKWKSVSKKSSDPFKYLYISGPENLIMKEANELGHRSFWESLPIKENDKLVLDKDEL